MLWRSFDPPDANLPGGKGTCLSSVAAGTWFWVDPINNEVFVGTIHGMTGPDIHNLLYRTHAAVYARPSTLQKKRDLREQDCSRYSCETVIWNGTRTMTA